MEYDWMKVQFKFPPCSELIKNWQSIELFYYYKKNLVEFGKPLPTLNSTPFNNTNMVSKSAKYLLMKLIRIAKSLIGYCLVLVRCAFATKGKVLVLNHSARKRLKGGNYSPLYLPEQYFKYDNMVIFEDQDVPYSYPSTTLKLSSQSLLELGATISLCISYLGRLIYRINDRNIVDFIVKYYLWLIALYFLKPNSVLLLVWYGKEPLIAACKKLNIEVNDLQHGIIYQGHPFYNISEGVQFKLSHYLLPDKCLVYGEYWRQNLLKSGWADSQVSVVGYFLDKSTISKSENDIQYILYSTAPHVKDAIIKHIRSIEKEVAKYGWMIQIAVHPADEVESYKVVLSENVKITTNDVYDALHGCEVLISVSSTLLWEAMVYDKPSYVIEYGFEAVDLLDDLIQFKFAKMLGTGEFPEPFLLPLTPDKEYFFSNNINLLDLNYTN